MISSLLHLVGLRPRVYYTLTNFRGGGKAPLPPLNTPMPPYVEPTDAEQVEEVDIIPRTATTQPATPATPPPSMTSAETPARPRRNRKPKKLYVPETGQWD